ncbi:probable serine/threonine-protein kinase PIX13 [Euphorbia lathyris]|uniref:probable serine/threonine-protein kinase PIX13 n=1 Tax=Euphorbia lathyris TaxID=212925 RepID=UPI00331408D8
MGNCFGTQVNNHQSPPTTTTHFTPGRQQHGVSTGNNSSNSNSNNYSSEDMSVALPPPPPPVVPVGRIVTPNLKVFALADLKSATRNFRPDTVLGEGGFGRVFKGWIDENTFAPAKVGFGMAVAVKKSNPDSSQGLEEWQSEVKFLGKFQHPNLVKLLGYCWEEKQFLLVYEHMQKGSLENHLFRRGAEALPWDIRIHIAIGAAYGLAFLHTSEKSVIYRDFKTSNILLDGNYNAKLSDFGLAKLGPLNGDSHVTTRVMGTYGYAAPEYVATGHLYVKSDVYGFGVVLLEMLTGRRALDTNMPSGEHILVEWATPSLSEKRKLKKIMDPRFEEDYSLDGAIQAAEVILKCLDSDPKNRPSMEEVLETLQRIRKMPKDNKVKEKKKVKIQQEEKSSSYSTPQYRSPLHSKHGGHGNGSRPYRSSTR